MNNTRKSQQKSSIFPENPYNTTGLTDNTPTNQNKALLSRIAGDSGRNCQDKPNFTAHISVIPVQKISFLGGVA